MPVRRSAVAAAAAALAVGGPVAFAAPAQATGGGDGRASAVVLRTGLDVSLLNKTLDVPLKASLNEVQAPASAEKTALTVQVEGVDQGRPLNVLRAEVASAKATADREKAEGAVTLAHAKVHVPGLPLLSLIEVEEVTSRAVCAAGEKPVAESNLLGTVRVLGKKVTLTAGGTTRVEAPGVGEVRLDLSRRETTSRTAAATALELAVSVNPLKLNVAEVQGSVTLAAATCEAPKPASAVPPAATPSATPSAPPEVEPQTVPKENLAETGGSSATPYVAAGAFALLAAGTAGVALARRRARD